MTNEELYDRNCEVYFGGREPLRPQGLDGDEPLDDYLDEEFGWKKRSNQEKSIVLQVDDVHHKVSSAIKGQEKNNG